MKARIVMPQELILGYGAPDQTEALCAAAAALGAEFCEITEGMLDTALSDCIAQGQRGSFGGTPEFSGDATVIFHGFTRKRLDEALERIAGLNIPLKAVVTQKNQSWTVRTLLAELAKERAWFAEENRRKQTPSVPLHEETRKGRDGQ